MVSQRGIRRVLGWCLIALYGAIMIPGQGLHALTACGHRAIERDASAPRPECRSAPLQAAAHDEGSCPICTCLFQAQHFDARPGTVHRSPPRVDRLDDAPMIAGVCALTGGHPRAPPRPIHV